RVGFDPIQQLSQLGRGQTDRGVRGAIVQTQLVTSFVMYHPAREDDIAHVARSLVRLMRTKDPLVSSPDRSAGNLQIQQRQSQSVKTAGRSIAHAVIDDQPSVWRLNRRRRETDFVSVPPRTLSGFQHYAMIAPMLQVRRIRQPDIRFYSGKIRQGAMQ